MIFIGELLKTFINDMLIYIIWKWLNVVNSSCLWLIQWIMFNRNLCLHWNISDHCLNCMCYWDHVVIGCETIYNALSNLTSLIVIKKNFVLCLLLSIVKHISPETWCLLARAIVGQRNSYFINTLITIFIALENLLRRRTNWFPNN